MKAKLIFFLFLVMFLSNLNCHSMGLKSKEQIKLESKIETSQRSLPQLPIAYIDGCYLSAELPLNFSSATIVVKNVETGEIACSLNLDSSTFIIDFTGMDEGKYVLEVHLNDNCFTGDFILEY